MSANKYKKVNHAGGSKHFNQSSLEGIRQVFKGIPYEEDFIGARKFFGETEKERAKIKEKIHYVKLDNGPTNIGLRGRMQAVIAFCSFASEQPGRIGSLVDKVLKNAESMFRAGEHSPGHFVENPCTKTLDVLLNNTRPNNLPTDSKFCESTAKHSTALVWTVNYVAKQLDRVCKVDGRTLSWQEIESIFLDELIDDGKPRAISSRDALLETLAERLGVEDVHEELPPAARSDECHYFGTGFENYAMKSTKGNRDRAYDVEEAVNTIVDALRQLSLKGRNRYQHYVLHGPEQMGKKSVIGDFLRRMRVTAESHDSPTCYFPLFDDDHVVSRKLPIFAVVVQRLSYHDLLAHVFAFLKRITDRDERREIEEIVTETRARAAKRTGPSRVLQDINDMHGESDAAALFVFADIGGMSRDAFRRKFYDPGFFRLLSTLSRSNQSSRFLLTQTSGTVDDWPIDPCSVGKLMLGSMPKSTIGRFDWYPDSETLERYQNAIHPELLLTDARQAAEIPGDALLTLSALMVMKPDNDAIIEAFNDVLDVVSDDTRDNETSVTLTLGKLIDALIEQDLLIATTLIAAAALTNDGLLEESLEILLDHWHEVYDRPIDPNAVAPSFSRIMDGLGQLSRGTQDLFVLIGDIRSYNPLEMGFSDRDPAKQHSLRMNRSTAKKFIDTLISTGHDLTTRRAFRQIALAARRRAQITRMREEPPPGARPSDTKRNIQSLLALLASLPATGLPDQRTKDNASIGNLRLRTGDVFHDDPDHSPDISFAFAVLILLRQDIDFRNQLTMVTDEDETRLSLYLTLFLPLGRFHVFNSHQLRSSACRALLPEKIPDHLRNVLHPHELAELLLTVAISAFHSQLEEVVAWAVELSQTVSSERQEGLEMFSEVRTRIDCVRFDAALNQSTCFPPSKRTEDNPGDLMTVRDEIRAAWRAWAERFVANHDGEIASQVARLLQAPRVISPERLSGNAQSDLFGIGQPASAAPKRQPSASDAINGMRLLVRLTEAEWMTLGDQAETRLLCAEIARMEHEFTRLTSDSVDPVVMSGRSGRRLVRALTGDTAVFALPSKSLVSDQDDLVRQILQANIARLGTYSGAERLGALVDHTRWHVFCGQEVEALEFIKLAQESLENSLISYAGKMEIIALYVGLQLSLWSKKKKAAGKPTQRKINTLLDKVRESQLLAKDLYLRPFQIVLDILEGRALVLLSTIAKASAAKQAQLRKSAEERFEAAAELASEIGFQPGLDCSFAWLEWLRDHA